MVIRIVEADDWICVFKDGKLVWGTHSCSIKDGLEALEIEFESVYLDYDSEEDINDLNYEGVLSDEKWEDLKRA